MTHIRHGVARDPSGLTRRELLRRGILLGAGLAGYSFLWGCSRGPEPVPTKPAAPASTPPAAQPAPPPPPKGSGQVLVRSLGGAWEEAWRKAAWEPFEKETGIKVVPVAANAAKMIAMVESGKVELDVSDLTLSSTLLLQQKGYLLPLDKAKLRSVNLQDLLLVTDYYVSSSVYGTVMGYNTEAFAGRKAPETWRDFWNVRDFPATRIMQDLAASKIDLEFALLADGVPMDKLYPIDLDRAFAKLREIRKNVLKFWDTGAVCAQMLADKVATLAVTWNTRIQPLIDQGAPLAYSWREGERITQVFAILKGAPNVGNAYQFISYCLQPQVQAAFARAVKAGAANRKAYDHIDPKDAKLMPTSPDNMKISYEQNAQWWVDNQAVVAERWQKFLLEK